MNALQPLQPATLDIGFARRDDRTVLDRRIFAWPFVLTRTFRLDAVPAHMLTVIVQTSSSAVHGEDRLTQRIQLGQGAAAHVTTQGATAIHRAHPGTGAREAVAISLGPEAFLEYLPEPRVLFPGAALDQSIDIDCAANAAIICADAFTVHDPGGCGDSFRQLTSTLTLRFEPGKPALVDRFDITQLGRGRYARYKAFGTIFMVAPLPIAALAPLALTQSLATLPGLYGAASLLPGNIGIGVRLAAEDLRAVRAGTDLAWSAFRTALYGQPPPSRRKG